MVAVSAGGVLMGRGRNPGGGSAASTNLSSGRKGGVNQLAKMVDQKEVRLLCGASARARDNELAGGRTLGLAAAAPEQGQAVEAEPFRLGQDGKNAGRVAAGSEDDQQIAGLGQAGELAGKHAIVPKIIGDAGEERAVGGEGDGGKGAAASGIAADQFGGKMLRLRRAAAVAAGEEFPAGAQGGQNHLAGAVNLRAKAGKRLECLHGFGELRVKSHGRFMEQKQGAMRRNFAPEKNRVETSAPTCLRALRAENWGGALF